MGDFLNIAVAAYGSRVEICSKSSGIKMAERVGFEFTRKRRFNNCLLLSSTALRCPPCALCTACVRVRVPTSEWPVMLRYKL